MGENWRELRNDPLLRDLSVIVSGGLYRFADDALTTLPTLLGDEGSPAERAQIRTVICDLVMRDEPGRTISHFEHLGRGTRFALTLMGATPDTRYLTATARREAAGRILRGFEVTADAIRRRPTAKQPRGGPEWQLCVTLRETLLETISVPPAPAAESARRTSAPTPANARPDSPPPTSLATEFFVEGYVHNSVAFRDALSSCRSLSLLGFSHNRMAVTYASELSHMMERGGRLRVLALDPAHPVIIEANQRSYSPKAPDDVRHQHEAALATLRAIGSRATDPRLFELRLMNCFPPYTVYLFDEDDDVSAQAFVWLTPWRMPSPERPGFRLRAAIDDGWYRFFAGQVVAMWKHFED